MYSIYQRRNKGGRKDGDVICKSILEFITYKNALSMRYFKYHLIFNIEIVAFHHFVCRLLTFVGADGLF